MGDDRDCVLDAPLCESDKYVLGEVENQAAMKYYKLALSAFWVAEVIDFSDDRVGFESLTQNEKRFILTVLAFFAASDGIVMENLAVNFIEDVQQKEMRLFYGFQIAMENIHSEVYTDSIAAYEPNLDKRRALYKSIDDHPTIRAKALWARQWMNKDRPFGERKVAFAAVEGIMFSASFCAIFHFKKSGVRMRGLFQSNEYISRDEGLHCDFACFVHGQLHPRNQCSKERILEIIRGAVDVESDFVRVALAEPIKGMSAAPMIQYVQFVADRLLHEFKCPKHYKVNNPFPWMETISMDGKTNFFEARNTDYSKAGVGGEKRGSGPLSFDTEF